MKRRLHQPPLPQVRRAFAGQQALAEQALARARGRGSGEVAVVGDEHVAG